MPIYREKEKDRHIQKSRHIFGPVAGQMGGTYNGMERPFCLHTTYTNRSGRKRSTIFCCGKFPGMTVKFM